VTSIPSTSHLPAGHYGLRVANALKTASDNREAHALLYLDLDQFKIVNDTCNHAAYDALIKQLVILLSTELRRQYALAGIGGDELGELPQTRSLDHASRIADSLRRAVEEFRFTWEGNPFRIGESIGLVSINHKGSSVASVMRDKEKACYLARGDGRNRVYVYREGDENGTQGHGETRWVNRTQHALENDRFVLDGKPIVSLHGNASESFHCEMLLGLIEDERELVAPGAFMPAAERYGRAVAIDRWVIARALSDLADHPQRCASLRFWSPPAFDRAFRFASECRRGATSPRTAQRLTVPPKSGQGLFQRDNCTAFEISAHGEGLP
jgi:diguanylate cyclase (GGDEF)-like protein